jgi:hypothetical protein
MFVKEGIIASPGIVIAKALVYEKIQVEVNKVKLKTPRLKLSNSRMR